MTYTPLTTNTKPKETSTVGEVPGQSSSGDLSVDEAKKQKVMLWLLVHAKRDQGGLPSEAALVTVGAGGPANPHRFHGGKGLLPQR